MRYAHGPHRRLPTAVSFALVVLALAAIAYPFRLPPASQAKSNDFYKTDGSGTARILKDAAETLICDIAGAGGVHAALDCRVEVPDIEHVPVLRASQGGIDVETVQMHWV